jgi:triosephosphate isomerase
MNKKLVAANWKMNGRIDRIFNLLEPLVNDPLEGVEVLVCPPFPYLLPAAAVLANSNVKLGAQNLAVEKDGAFTGEVAAEMLVDCGVTHVLVGHSERRAFYGESDDLVARKFLRAIEANLIPVLCVGETLSQREAGETETVIARQLDAVLQVAGSETLHQAVVAYEPVWAIGTGLTATPEQAQSVHAFIRSYTAKRDLEGRQSEGVSTKGHKNGIDSPLILYGGSVKADNAASLFAQPDIDGGLIGGASLDSASFRAICQAAI